MKTFNNSVIWVSCSLAVTTAVIATKSSTPLIALWIPLVGSYLNSINN